MTSAIFYVSRIDVSAMMDIIPHSLNVQNLRITMSSDCTFNVHTISSLSKRCKNLTGWILRTFISRDKLTMLTLFKALVLSRLDYGSQLWSPHKICQSNQIEKIQRVFTKHITGMYDLPYTKRLKMLNLNSLHRRRDIIYLWKILEGLDRLVPNYSDPIACSFSDRRGQSCIVSHVNPGHQGTLAFNSFRWRSIRILIDFLSIYVTFLHVLLTGLSLNLTSILGQSLIYHLNPDTTTVWMEEMAFNGRHYVMA